MSRLKEALSTISKVEIGKTLLEIIRINVLRRGKIRLVTYPEKMATGLENGCKHANLSNKIRVSSIFLSH